MKKNIKVIGIILCISSLLLIGASVIFILRNKENTKDDLIEEKKVSNVPASYDISLSDSENFSMVTEAYNNDNNLNIVITSKSIYSYLVADVKAYDSVGELSNEFTYNFNLIDAGDSMLINLSVDADVVDSIVVDVSNIKENENLIVYNKKLLDFSTNVNGDSLELVSENKLNSDLLFVKGYVLFYKENKLVDTLPFNIENISKGNNISTSITNTNKEYDKVIIHTNELY